MRSKPTQLPLADQAPTPGERRPLWYALTQHAPGSAARLLGMQSVAAGLPEPQYEVAFWPGRAFRFDCAWPAVGWACEIDGGVWTGGRHTTGPGYSADVVKLNEATLLGWRVLHCTPTQIQNGAALTWVERALGRDE